MFISGPLEGRGGLIERDGLINSVPIEDGGLITRRRLINSVPIEDGGLITRRRLI